MEFFTFDWWCGLLGDIDPRDSYYAHLDGIRDRLPPDVLRLENELSIHDATLVALELGTAARTLTLVLDGYDRSGGPCSFTLLYAGLRSYRSVQSDEPSFPDSNGYGDLGYWEAHLAGDAFEHRFLFSTGIELRVVFEGLTLSQRDG